jgi:hypothetical protein
VRRRILLGLAAVLAALAIAPSAGANEASETCRRFGAEWRVCVWLLEPNPSGGDLFHVVICEGATCIVVEQPILN